jgi:hypothetical protein
VTGIRAWLAGGASAAALAFAGAGCGGSSPPPPADPATVAPADSILYADATVRPEGEIKTSLETALSKLLGAKDVGRYITAQIDHTLAKDDLTYAADVEPWLGERGAVFYQSFGQQPKAAVILQATDTGAATDTLEKVAAANHETPKATDYQGVEVHVAGDDTYAAIGSLVVAGPKSGVEAAVDASKGQSLADSGGFKSSLASAPADRVFTAWADPKGAFADAVKSDKVDSEQVARFRKEFGAYVKGPAAAWGDVTDDYLAVELSLSGPSNASAADSSLISDFPDDSWFAFGAHQFGQGFEQGLKQIEATSPADLGGSTVLERLREALGVDVGNVGKWLGDVSGFLGGSSIVGLGGALVATTRDPEASAKSLAQLQRLFERDIDVTTKPLGSGRTGFTVTPQGAPGEFVFEQRDGKVVAGFGQDSVDAVLDPRKTLADSPSFKTAEDALAGLTPSFYLDFGPISTLLNIPGVSTNPNLELAKPYLDRLDYIVVGSGVKDDRVLARIVLGVQSADSSTGSVASAGAPAYAAVSP